jgi:hypothetical protein
MRSNWFSRVWSGWLIVGGIGTAVFLTALAIGGIFFLAPAPLAQSPNPVFTIIPVPTTTPTVVEMIQAPTATPTFVYTEGGINVGVFVQVSGTGVSGLRLREGPGTTHPQRFIGMEEEVFAVKDGPQFSDGFTWWYLEAPYDSSRSGWAAGQYLSVVPTGDN